jgi:hypothetical protein
VVVRRTPDAVRAVAALAERPTSLIANSRAFAADSSGFAAAVGRFATGEPSTLMSCPVSVTWAFSPLPNTGTPPTVWMKLRWWVPAMSTYSLRSASRPMSAALSPNAAECERR